MAVATPEDAPVLFPLLCVIKDWPPRPGIPSAGYTGGFAVLVIPLEANIAAIILNSWIPGICVAIFISGRCLLLTGSNLLERQKLRYEFESGWRYVKAIAILWRLSCWAPFWRQRFYPYAE